MRHLWKKSTLKNSLLIGLLVGTLDILFAILFLARGNAGAVLRHIARAALGEAAQSEGAGILLLGLIFHYFIALCFSTAFYLLYPQLALLRKNKVLTGILYGLFIWAFMQLLVLPFTHTPPQSLSVNAWKSILIHIFALGLPITYLSYRGHQHLEKVYHQH